jgi:ribosomal protein L14
MLRIGSRLNIYDNSGALKLQIINMGRKKTHKKSSLNVCSIAKGVIKESVPNKKIQKKMMVNVLITSTRKKYSRKNGFYVNFNKNVGVLINKERYTPLATRVKNPVAKELRFNKKYKIIIKKAKRLL